MNKKWADEVDVYPVEQTFLIYDPKSWGRIKTITGVEGKFWEGRMKYIEMFYHEPIHTEPTHSYLNIDDLLQCNNLKRQNNINSYDFAALKESK